MKKQIFLIVAFVAMTLVGFAQSTIYGGKYFDIEIMIADRVTMWAVPDTDVHLYDKDTGAYLESCQSDSSGMVHFRLDAMRSYEIRTCKTKYINAGLSIKACQLDRDNDDMKIFCMQGGTNYNFVASGGEDKPIAHVTAQLLVDEIVVGKTFKLDNIYFDVNKADLKPVACVELDKVYQILTQYPSMKIELSSHTDSRASDSYNDELSHRRAVSTYDYLVQKGISPNRMVAQGYGESQLVNRCADGVNCSEDMHQQNRRTEFKVLSFEGTPCPNPALTGSMAAH